MSLKAKLVIFAGGIGTRLWPLSNESCPKQFLQIFEDNSSFQHTILRNQFLGQPTVVITKDSYEISKAQAKEIGIQPQFIVESYPKNTAACVISASLQAKKDGYDTIVLVPADHCIQNQSAYFSAVDNAITYSTEYGICTIGIQPTCVNSEYGYLKGGHSIGENLYLVDAFIEKPSQNLVLEYFKSEICFWNSGIFVCNVDFIITQMQQMVPEIFEVIYNTWLNASYGPDEIYLQSSPIYEALDNISFDTAIMENLSNIAMVKADFDWLDLGYWHALWESIQKDSNNNYINGRVIASDVSSSWISSDKQFTAVVGLENIVVVNTEQALLIFDKSKIASASYIKNLIQRQKKH